MPHLFETIVLSMERCYYYPTFFSAAKILRCAGGSDSITLKAEDNADSVTFIFESPSKKMLLSFMHDLYWNISLWCCRSRKGVWLWNEIDGFGWWSFRNSCKLIKLTYSLNIRAYFSLFYMFLYHFTGSQLKSWPKVIFYFNLEILCMYLYTSYPYI